METLEFPHVLWIGGPSGSGKTTIGKRLAINHGLRYFGIDKLMQVHHSRGLERGLPAMTRWDELTPDERWLANPQEMAALLMAISDETWSLLLEDLRALPQFPGIVVEGRPLRPSFVAPLSDQRDPLLPAMTTDALLLRGRVCCLWRDRGPRDDAVGVCKRGGLMPRWSRRRRPFAGGRLYERYCASFARRARCL
jgi:hypothetical protein